MEKIEMTQPEPIPKQSTSEDEEYPAEHLFKENEPLLDLESQHEEKQELAHRATEPAVSRTKTFVFLATYFIMNLSLTFYNKAVMGSFPFPWILTAGDYYFTALGFTLTLIGVVLAAIKTVVTNRLMTGRLRLPALELLLRMGPLAAVQSLLYSVLIGEFSEFLDFVKAGHLTAERILTVSGNGLLAFGLNVASFETNKLAGALTLTICANLKQCLTIVLGAFLWDVPVSPMNGAGILLALAGGAWYSSIELRAKARASG
ncbi:unnamed protein product [Alternaria alternata]